MSKFYKLNTAISRGLDGIVVGKNGIFIINLDKVYEFKLMFEECSKCKDDHKTYWLWFRYDTFSTQTVHCCQNSSTNDLFTDYINICCKLGVNTDIGDLGDSFYAQDCINKMLTKKLEELNNTLAAIVG